MLCLGMKDSDTERMDSTLPRKLRSFFCFVKDMFGKISFCLVFRLVYGRRKGAVQLLGGAWSRELDGGDPLLDRNCLFNTARRTVLAHSFLDIATQCRVTKASRTWV